MELKRPIAKPPASVTSFSLADKQTELLRDKILPHIPHLLSVPTRTPYQPDFPHENLRTPFKQAEVMKLQYMTFISHGDRGVAIAQGRWEDDVYNTRSPSAGAMSNNSTPNPNLLKDSGKPAAKMSYSDYQKYKATGVKPPLRPATATPEPSSRNEIPQSKIAANTPVMARVRSFEEEHSKQNGVAPKRSTISVDDQALSKEEKSAPPRSVPPVGKDDAHTALNGNALSRTSLQAKDNNKNISSSRQEPPVHPLPPRPQSPRSKLSTHEPKQNKRHLEIGLATSQPEKRAKGDSQKAVPRKSEVVEAKTTLLPPKKPVAVASPRPPRKVVTPSTKPLNSNSNAAKIPSSDKPLDIPPLLSPLPTDLVEPPQPRLPALKRSEKPKSTPSPKAMADGENPDLKSSENTSSSPLTTPPASSSPPFVLPRLLSPDLPEVVEQELFRLHQKTSAPSALNTVEARHQEVRQPNAPGVAQKRPKVGHPPKKMIEPSSISKKTHGESSNSKKKPADPVTSEPSFIVKIPYKKKQAKDVERILRIRASPSDKFKKMEAKHLDDTEHQPQVEKAEEDSEDEPLRRRAKKAPAVTTAKKAPAATTISKVPPVSTPANRKRPVEPSERTEPESKRTKIPEKSDAQKMSEKLDAPKASPAPLAAAFKSPGPSASREKSLLVTPKKGDAMKSVAMRRVDSNDGNARTPQAPASSSAPPSAEKPRVNGIHRATLSEEETRRLREADAKFLPLGTKWKRKLQGILNENPSEPQFKEGVLIGIEGLLAYMIAFHSRTRLEQTNPRPPTPQLWEGFFPVCHFVTNQSKRYPELLTLVENLGAVSLEQLVKIYLEQTKEAQITSLDKMASHIKDKDRLWSKTEYGRRHMTDLGAPTVLGPWSSVYDAVGFASVILTKYAAREKLQWKSDPQLAEAYARYISGLKSDKK